MTKKEFSAGETIEWNIAPVSTDNSGKKRFLPDTPVKIEIPGLETYPGGKGGHGVYQKIINQIPGGIKRYMEPFAGGASIARWIRPADEMIINELDPAIYAIWETHLPKGWKLYNENAMALLIRCLKFQRETFIFIDPPYLPETCNAQYNIYDCMLSEEQHAQLCNIVNELHCYVAICCYDNPLYQKMLSAPKWRKLTYMATTRGASREETVYMNYPEPTILHDYRFFGENNKKREYTQNMIRRTISRFDAMDKHRRQAILSAIVNKYSL